jgi:hypothetical protein
VTLTLRGRQHCGPVGRRAGIAAAKISTALDTLADTDEALAADPAIPAATEGRTQLPCSPNGSGWPYRPTSRKYVTPAGVTQTIFCGHLAEHPVSARQNCKVSHLIWGMVARRHSTAKGRRY